MKCPETEDSILWAYKVKEPGFRAFLLLFLINGVSKPHREIVILNEGIEKINLSLNGEHATVRLTFISY